MYNMPLLHRQMLDVLGIKDAAKLVPLAEDQQPTDPVTENQNILMNKPVKAFAYQNHEAHIMVHMNAMQDPKILKVLGQSPQAQTLQAAMQAHINEHLGFAYRVEIEKQLGMNLPPQMDDEGEENHIDPEVEAMLAPMLAQASQQLLSMNQQQAAQQQAMQQAQDPMVQMQQQELQIKQAEQQRKAQKDQADVMLKTQQQQIERERIASQAQQSMQANVLKAQDMTQAQKMKALESVAKMQNDRRMEMMRVGADLMKDRHNRRHDLDKIDHEALVDYLRERDLVNKGGDK